jgi:hypothetical protein
MGTTQTTTGRKAGKESNMDFTTIPAGCATVGDVTPLGTIEQVSLTAYLINGQWVPFHKVHGKPARAAALAIPQEWVDALSAEAAEAMQRQSDANVRALFAR